METYFMTFLHDESDRKEAFETFEDIQSELSAMRIPFEKGRGKSLIVYHISITFQDVSKQPTIKAFQQKLFAPSSWKHSYEERPLESLADDVSYHRRPFQSLAELALDIQREVRSNPTYQAYLEATR